MNRVICRRSFRGVIVLISASIAGCGTSGGLPTDFRAPPAILGSDPGGDPLLRRFAVDLRRFPDATRINWDFGDGGTMTGLSKDAGREVSHQFARAGIFTVRVHLFGAASVETPSANPLITTGSLPVEVQTDNVAPAAIFLVNNLRDADGNDRPRARRFDGSRSRDPDGILTLFSWDFGDGATGTGSSVEHEFTGSGRFTVTLTVTDDRGATASSNRVLVINVPPTAVIDSEITSDPAQLTVQLDGSGSSDSDGTITEFRWNFGDNTPEATGQIVTHTYATPNTYTVTLRVTDSAGAITTATRSVSVTGVNVFVRSATPEFAEVGQTSSLTIDGENFLAGATARLERTGNPVLTATSVTVTSAQQLTASFNLTGVTLGDYDVVVENPGGRTSRISAAFRVVSTNRVRLETSLGDVVVELVPDAPITTANFRQYVTDGFYDGTIFHRIVRNFVVQGGGFLPGNVAPPGLRPPIQNEFSPSRSNIRGTLAMAKLGGNPDSATSQFFFNLSDNSANLDNQNGGFTVFARVVEGQDVVDAIAAVPLNGETPVTDVLLIRARRE